MTTGDSVAGTDGRRARRLTAGVVVAVAGVATIAATFLGWITTATATGGRTSISGWGTISGGAAAADGANINDLAGPLAESTYQPGLIASVLGAVIMILGLIIAATGAGRRPSRIIAGMQAAAGLIGAGYGATKAIRPGDLWGVLGGNDAAPGSGPIVVAVVGVVVLAVGVALLCGAADPLLPTPRRGIQP